MTEQSHRPAEQIRTGVESIAAALGEVEPGSPAADRLALAADELHLELVDQADAEVDKLIARPVLDDVLEAPSAGTVPPYRAGLEISDRHYNHPLRVGVDAEALVFEIAAHHYVGRYQNGSAELYPEDFELMRLRPGWFEGEPLDHLWELARKLHAAHLWEHAGEDDESEGFRICSPTIRYWSDAPDSDDTDGGAA